MKASTSCLGHVQSTDSIQPAVRSATGPRSQRLHRLRAETGRVPRGGVFRLLALMLALVAGPAAAHAAETKIATVDLKKVFDLPEAVISDNTVTFGEPVRVGDRLRTWQVLRNVSTPKKTKLGLGRFWDIEVEYVNQRGEWVGTETYTGFGYRRES